MMRCLAAAAIAVTCVPAGAATRPDRQRETETLLAADGTSYLVTSGVVRVPELRGTGTGDPGTIDLAVVRVRAAGRAAGPSTYRSRRRAR